MGALPVILGRRIGVARRAALAIAGVLALVVLCVLAVFTDLQPRCAPDSGTARPMSDEIPAVYVPMYEQAATVFGVNRFLLAALHKQETDFGRAQLPGVTSGVNSFGCCAGPMQFNLSDTWTTHQDAHRQGTRPTTAYPHRASEHPSVYDPFDAIMAAGHKLAADGADRTLTSRETRGAVLAYNQDAAYVTAVIQQAQAWQRAASDIATNSGTEEVGVRLRWPTDVTTISSRFGARSSPCAGCSSRHEGIDIAAPAGSPVRASATGEVIRKASVAGYGNQVCVRHTHVVTCYAHLARFGHQPIGATVVAGEVIGLVGSTGSSTGPHLHFEVRRGTTATGSPIDPETLMSDAPTEDAELAAVCAAAQFTGVPDDESAGSLAWPTVGGRVIGHSNAPGTTHDPRAWPGGWQSDNALDIAVPISTPVTAVADGVICASCGYGPSRSASAQLAGQRLTLTTRDNAIYYAHLSRLIARPGQTVKQGELIGYSGAANGVAHLHIALQHGVPEDLLPTPTTSGATA